MDKAGSTVMWCAACWAYVEWIHKCRGDVARAKWAYGSGPGTLAGNEDL